MRERSVRRRLRPQAREQLIVATAIRFFAERGFDGSTAELAKCLGTTQPLLYRYFPTKQALIKRVSEEAMGSAFAEHLGHWVALLEAQDGTVTERLLRFYESYFREAMSYERFRLYLLSGLGNVADNLRYPRVVQEALFPRIVQLLRLAWAPDTPRTEPPTAHELAAVSALHGSVFYLAIRKWVHSPPSLTGDIREVLRLHIMVFVTGAKALYGGAANSFPYVAGDAVTAPTPPRSRHGEMTSARRRGPATGRTAPPRRRRPGQVPRPSSALRRW